MKERKKHLAAVQQQKREAAKAKQALLRLDRYRVVPIAASGQEAVTPLSSGDIGSARVNATKSDGSEFAAAFKQRPRAIVPKISAAQKARIEKIRHNAERKALKNKGLPYELSEKRPVLGTATVEAEVRAERESDSSDEENRAPLSTKLKPLTTLPGDDPLATATAATPSRERLASMSEVRGEEAKEGEVESYQGPALAGGIAVDTATEEASRASVHAPRGGDARAIDFADLV